ncbi:MAG TPA: glycosyltransferase [Streptosporangiaceae bacterium]
MIITNRDRTGPIEGCLGSLAAQDTPPAWVLLADLGSAPSHRAALVTLADRYQVSYLRIEHSGAWNKSLAFNTAFRLALTSLPAVSHVIQLDADAILHPHLLTETAAQLRSVSAFCCAPRMATAHLDLWAIPGDLAGYEHMLSQCGPMAFARAVGVFMVLPAAWLAEQRGFDEAYTGWGHEDTEMWWRVRDCLSHRKDIAGSRVIHQWHPRQPGAGEQGPNWPLFIYRIANSDTVTNPVRWGGGQVTESMLRTGVTVPHHDDRKTQLTM